LHIQNGAGCGARRVCGLIPIGDVFRADLFSHRNRLLVPV
jgi:hypothetical protein